MLIIITTLILLAYIFFDVNRFIRAAIHALVAKYFRSKLPILGTSTVYGITLLSDLDISMDHMKNGRVLREFDFAKLDYGIRSGLVEAGLKTSGGFLINANFIRYRLPIRPFSLFKIETRLTSWGLNEIYMEQKLITLNDGLVRAVAYQKLSCFKCNLKDMLNEISPKTESPEVDDIVKNVNEACEVVSKRFKKI